MQAPDVAGEIIAFRGWHLRTGWRRVDLSSFNGFIWPTGAWTVAECDTCGADIPGESCACGIYAARDRAHLHRIGYMGQVATVFGEVGLVGKVIPGTLGWRAARAHIRRLWLPHALWEHAHTLRAAYAVPVALTNPFERTA
jgi:hypothetical protein